MTPPHQRRAKRFVTRTCAAVGLTALCTVPAPTIAADVALVAETATATAPMHAELPRLLKLLSGEFNNAEQVKTGNTDYKATTPNSYLSHLHHSRRIISSPHLAGQWLYTQINRVDRTGKIYRQAYMHFTVAPNGDIVSRAHSLRSASKAKSKKTPTDKQLNRLRLRDLQPSLAAGCETRWRRELDQFVGSVNPDTCVIDSKYADEKRRVFAEEIVGASGFWALEGAFKMDGTLAFGLQPPNYFRYRREATQ